MNKRDVVLAGLAAAGSAEHSPVQAQKLFFLVDKTIPHAIAGPVFHFKPHAYGPFDADVYNTIERLAETGHVEIQKNPNRRFATYRLTESGLSEGKEILSRFDPEIQNYVASLSEWVRSLRFDQLVSAIYKEYPDMKVNSVFRG